MDGAGREKRCIKAQVRGRVQGVGYRAWTVAQAQLLSISGWVRNAEDGSVELLACGAPSAIGEFIRLLHRGPPYAEVVEVGVLEESSMPETEQFHVLR